MAGPVQWPAPGEDQQPPPPRRRGAGRWFVPAFLIVLGTLAFALVALWWWTGTQASLDWVLRRYAQPLGVEVQAPRGSLRTGIAAKRLAWSQDGLKLVATDVDAAWRVMSLVRQRQLHLSWLRAGTIEVTDKRPKTDERPQPPQRITLPLDVRVDEIRIGRLSYDGATQVQAENIAGSYGYDGAAHDVRLERVDVQGGRWSAEGHIGARAPLDLRLSLQGELSTPVPGTRQNLPLRVQAQAQGPLQGFEATVLAQQVGDPQASLPSATVTAQVTPFEPMPLRSANVRLQDFDAAALWPQAPRTALAGSADLKPLDAGAWAIEADLSNAQPGPWDRKRVPVSALQVEGEWKGGSAALIRSLRAEVGGGVVEARGEGDAAADWEMTARVRGVNPAAVHGAMASLPVGGTLQARMRASAIDFAADLASADVPPARRRQAPPGDPQLTATLSALQLRQVRAKGRWNDGELRLDDLLVRTADARLEGSVTARPAEQRGQGRLVLQAPGLRARVDGSAAARSGGGQAEVNASEIAAALAWLRTLPGIPADVLPALRGSGSVALDWQGGWLDPAVQARANVPLLAPADAGAQPPPAAWSVRELSARVEGRLSSARFAAQGQGQMGPQQLSGQIDGTGGRDDAGAWSARAQAQASAVQGNRRISAELTGEGTRKADGAIAARIDALRATALDPQVLRGEWSARLLGAVPVTFEAGMVQAGAGEAVLTAPVRSGGGSSDARIAWEPLRVGGGELRTAGRITGLPLAWAELFMPGAAGAQNWSGDLVFDAQWDADLGGQQPRLRATVQRVSGDITVLAENAEGVSTRIAAGVREARLSVDGSGEAVTLGLRWDSERAGTAGGSVRTRLAHEGNAWSWPEQAPLDGRIQASLPRLAVWSLLAPPGWRLRGSIDADVRIAGTRSDPRLNGTLTASDLALRSVVDGIAVQDGVLRARIDGRQLVIDELLLRGAGPDGGLVRATGTGSWTDSGPQLNAQATLDHLRASVRSDRRLVVSGALRAVVDPQRTEITGQLRIDEALIQLPEASAPRLGDDVVVRNLPPGVSLGRNNRETSTEGPGGRPLRLSVEIDLGQQFRVQGRGASALLRGSLTVAGTSLTQPRIVGVVNTFQGTFEAYGQDLSIERGVLRFTGPADNPALDIIAIRRNMLQRVGVQVTGRAQSPVVRLYSEPEMSEAEKLSWLVLGRPSASGGAEAALLQEAAKALLAQRFGGGGPGIAGRLGLDELSFSRGGEAGPSVTLGKRFAQNFYASYERSLSGALGTLFIFYEISRRLTLRAETGENSGVDLIYTFTFN